jgi:hypothetical protein
MSITASTTAPSTAPAPTSTHLRLADPPRRRRRTRADDDAGMSTVEYAIGTVAAAAFAAVLYVVISGQPVVDALTQLVQRALTAAF